MWLLRTVTLSAILWYRSAWTFTSGALRRKCPHSSFQSAIVVDRDTGEEWQQKERRGLLDYRTPPEFSCDPRSHPGGGAWLLACPWDFQWLDRQHGITARPVTGLESSRHKGLNECNAKGLARQRCKLWPLLKDLAQGFLLSSSDLRGVTEIRSMLPGCPVSLEELRSHPCIFPHEADFL